MEVGGRVRDRGSLGGEIEIRNERICGYVGMRFRREMGLEALKVYHHCLVKRTSVGSAVVCW